MAQYHWTTAPTATREQVMRLCQSLKNMVGERLSGIYLHGSLAMGCFNPLRSDVDILVVLSEPLAAQLAARLARLLLDLSLHPHPIEISFMTQEQLVPWRFPTPYDFHYGENWRSRMESRLASGGQGLLADASPGDPDLAAHFTILRHRGIVLSGPSIETVFPAVPAQDYLSAIWQYDMADCGDWIETNPVYAVLNLCRVLAYVTDRLIVSKDEGGEWALNAVSQTHREMVELALALYRGDTIDDASQATFDPEELHAFAEYMTARISEGIETPNS